jgi:uncharacterized membrane protein YkvA (DUF1232 family)
MNMNPSFWSLLRHLPKFIRLVFRLLTDRRVPLLAKIAVCSSVAYLIWPLDIIPDFLVPVVGSFDDVALLLVCLRYLFYRTPPEVLQEHLKEIQSG